MPQRSTGAGGKMQHMAVDPEQRAHDLPCAVAALLQRARQLVAQLLNHGQNIALERDRLEEPALGCVRRYRPPRRDCFARKAQGLIETGEQLSAKPRGQWRARQIGDVADTLQADTQQRIDGVGWQFQRGERQRQQHGAHAGVGDDPAGAVARNAPGAGGRTRDRGFDGEALCRQPVVHGLLQRRFAGKQMRAAGDVEHDAVWRVEPGVGRPAARPIGEAFEDLLLGLGIGVGNTDVGMARAHVGKGQTRIETECGGGRIDGCDPDRGPRAQHGDQRRAFACPTVLRPVVFNMPLSRRQTGAALDPVGRQMRQRDRQEPACDRGLRCQLIGQRIGCGRFAHGRSMSCATCP